MRINVSVTIAAMTNATYTTFDHGGGYNQTVETCPKPNNSTESTNENGEFLWTAHQQELIIAGFFYGYSVSQIPAGWLTDKIGGTRVFGFGMFISGISSLLGPTAAWMGPEFLLAIRIFCGFFEGGTMSSLGSMFSRWYPGDQNSYGFAIAMSGAKFGTFFGTIISGMLSGTNFLGGWPSTYYFFGTITVTWAFLWSALIYESPHLHPRLSREEFDYLSSAAVTEKTGKIAIPVKSIILSIPVWAIIICSFVGTWANNVVFTNQPIYLKHVQGMNIELIGILSSIPFLAEGGMLVLCSKLAIKLINDKTLSVVATRKLLTAIGLGLTAGSFLLLAYVGCNSALSVVLMISATGFNGIASSGYYVNLMDIAPRFAGSLLGFVNTSSAISGALTPYVIGVFTTNQADILGWQTVFFISTGLTLLAALVYSILGSGEVQEWAKSSNEETL
ncbi:putative inorganic phosphate cotransporter [Lytechinus variegatus]|uniref:putative inorganic phosphate cotransporter n=1 Tax=Lytechinus variegatus TaxID=7654 RepID=UPI001BB20D4B|nr:putative inorganic phosphate cotransporter [Lytechinus variegatus]